MDRLPSILRLNQRQPKPRSAGVTEIRGPYYSVLGARMLSDLLETMGAYVDALKFAGGSFCLMPDERVRELIDVCHRHEVSVSTGGFLERALPLGAVAVDHCLAACRSLGFDTIEVSAGFVSVPPDDLVALARRAMDQGFRVKPEVGIQFGAGGGTSAEQLGTESQRDIDEAIRMADRYLELGVPLVMIESEGLTESVNTPRTDLIGRLVGGVGLDRLMFEAADPPVFSWHVKNYGPDVNLFVDHSHIIQLEALRSGLWGTADSCYGAGRKTPGRTDGSRRPAARWLHTQAARSESVSPSRATRGRHCRTVGPCDADEPVVRIKPSAGCCDPPAGGWRATSTRRTTTRSEGIGIVSAEECRRRDRGVPGDISLGGRARRRGLCGSVRRRGTRAPNAAGGSEECASGRYQSRGARPDRGPRFHAHDE